ncbi:IS256 family transposase, partial [Solemya velum gill symbiont]
MNEKEIRALANKIAKNIKTEDDLNDFSRILKKITV